MAKHEGFLVLHDKEVGNDGIKKAYFELLIKV